MDDYRRVLGLAAARLDRDGIAYMLSGSTALGFYGRPRMTRDLDIVVELRLEQVPLLEAAFGGDFSVDLEEIADAIRRRSMFNFVHFDTVVKIDFIVRKESAYRRVEFERRRTFDQDGQLIWVVSPEDLVLSKLVWAKDSHSEVQLRDVRDLMEFLPALDAGYLSGWAEQLEVLALLEEVTRR
jgi:hypothetical protein